MRYRALGSSGIEASVVGLGTWAIGGWMWGGTDEPAAIKAIHAGIDAGINLVDTAPVYGFGLSEKIVGRAIRGRRERVVLATKCALVWDRKDGEFYFNSTDRGSCKADGAFDVYKCLKPDSIRLEVERSLTRLGTDYIDLYQTHWPDSTTAIADTMEALLDLKQQGKIRAIGVCNATAQQMADYGLTGVLDSDQEKYSMLDRAQETANLPY